MTEPPITNDWALSGDFQDPNILALYRMVRLVMTCDLSIRVKLLPLCAAETNAPLFLACHFIKGYVDKEVVQVDTDAS